jgi:2-dehydro-3-deoxygalactonokinase
VSAGVVIGDWGSTRLRVWRLERGEVAERREGPGMLACGDPTAALASTIGDWGAERVILSGMAGARVGLCEAPYIPCPASSAQWKAMTQDSTLAGSKQRIAAGLSCRDASGRPEVMRGEETQVFGAIALDPSLADGVHVVLLPGTHSKWVWLEGGAIARFRTCVTGELFALLGGSSLLAAGGAGGDDDEEAGFAAGLRRADEGGPLPALFEARAAQLRDGRSRSWACGFVSGLLIGAEVAEMAVPGAVLAIGDAALVARYGKALAGRGVAMRAMDGEACAIAGLRLLDDD